jgi:hypothetical protein
MATEPSDFSLDSSELSHDSSRIPPEFLNLLEAVTGKRPRTVVEHILKYGYITTEDLREQYGYDDPRRAIQDARDQGIPIISYRVQSSTGKSIAAYKFNLGGGTNEGNIGGRQGFSKKFKNSLLEVYGNHCALCNGVFSPRELQIDHRVPYKIAQDSAPAVSGTIGYMLLCGSCNRKKSWACEHCPNWIVEDEKICLSCYWAYPTAYEHVATVPERRVDIVWSGAEIEHYELLQVSADQASSTVAQHIKNLIKKFFSRTAQLFFA